MIQYVAEADIRRTYVFELYSAVNRYFVYNSYTSCSSRPIFYAYRFNSKLFPFILFLSCCDLWTVHLQICWQSVINNQVFQMSDKKSKTKQNKTLFLYAIVFFKEITRLAFSWPTVRTPITWPNLYIKFFSSRQFILTTSMDSRLHLLLFLHVLVKWSGTLQILDL